MNQQISYYLVRLFFLFDGNNGTACTTSQPFHFKIKFKAPNRVTKFIIGVWDLWCKEQNVDSNVGEGLARVHLHSRPPPPPSPLHSPAATHTEMEGSLRPRQECPNSSRAWVICGHTPCASQPLPPDAPVSSSSEGTTSYVYWRLLYVSPKAAQH